jgi:RNA-directed DNA polymerase
VDKAIMEGKTRIIDLDLRAYFDNVQHYLLLAKVTPSTFDGVVARTGKIGPPHNVRVNTVNS